jgi:hypothetical protein
MAFFTSRRIKQMNIDQKIIDRLDELIKKGEEVIKTNYSRSGGGIVYFGDRGINSEMSHQWGMSCLNILERVFGKESAHYQKFNGLYSQFEDYTPVLNVMGILKAAKDDYENGYIFETRVLIQAEVFDDILEQAEHLLSSGYHQPAAVVAGAVLEDGLRKLCQRRGISLPAKPTINPMNDALAKDGAYNSLVQKRVTTLADLRNKAAHGKFSEFSEDDVKDMLAQVRSFMEKHFS